MPSSASRKKVPTTSSTSRPSILDTMLLTSTPLRRSPLPSSMHSTRSATNLTLQQIFKEKNQTYEDMQLLKMAKTRHKKEKKSSSKATTTSTTTTGSTKTLRKRSRSRKSMVAEEEDEEDETENDEAVATTRKKPHRSKPKGSDEPLSKKLRRTAAINEKRTTQKAIGFKGKSSAGSSDGGTSAEEEQEETRLIEQSKLYIEGPGVRQNYKKVNEHNAKIGVKLQNLHGHSTSAPTNAAGAPTNLPSPILSRSAQHASRR